MQHEDIGKFLCVRERSHEDEMAGTRAHPAPVVPIEYRLRIAAPDAILSRGERLLHKASRHHVKTQIDCFVRWQYGQGWASRYNKPGRTTRQFGDADSIR